MLQTNEALTLLCGTKAGADMFPPGGPVLRAADFQAPRPTMCASTASTAASYSSTTTPWGQHCIPGGRPEDFNGGFKEAQAWVKAVRGEAELVVKPEQAYTVTCILDSIYRSAAQGEAVKVA